MISDPVLNEDPWRFYLLSVLFQFESNFTKGNPHIYGANIT